MADQAGAPPAPGRAGGHEPDHGAPHGAPRGAARGGVKGWVTHHEAAAMILGAAGVGAVYLIMRQSPGTAAGTVTSQTGVQPGGTYDPGAYGPGDGSAAYDALANQMQALQESLSQGTVATSPAVPVTVTALPKPAQPAAAPKPAQKTWVPPRTITVGKGQTLLSLSRRYLGTSNRTALAHANRLGTGAGLRTGQRLTVPGHYA